MYFNNGVDRPDPKYSSVEIITPPLLSNGTYQMTGNLYGPANPDRIYSSTPVESFYSRIMGGAEMMANGNILICSSLQGRFFEVNANDEIVWEYKVPITANGIVGRDYFPTSNNFVSDPIFRVRRYLLNYPAFDGKTLTPGEPIEGGPWDDCDLITAVEPILVNTVQFYPNPTNHEIKIDSKDRSEIEVELISSQGQKIKSVKGMGTFAIPVDELPSGLYILKINQQIEKIIIQH
ncbi:MAG: T9SS type A sorting domain-containing protein [Flammeovirgaceae bacterium]|nr:T9SS type A sorting domain-containing protein [Flammeovirgaceae bacterium]